jgi:hypothetical protein
MPRRYSYAPIGQRCYGYMDWGAKGRTNVIGALLLGLLLTVTLFTGNINSIRKFFLIGLLKIYYLSYLLFVSLLWIMLVFINDLIFKNLYPGISTPLFTLSQSH